MKKGIIVLLIAVLASSFAFATLTGSAGIVYEATFAKDAFTFDTTNKKALDFKFTFTSDEVKVDSSEDAIHVEVAASAKFILGKLKGADGYGVEIVADAPTSNRGIGIVASIDTAKIVGKNWYVSVLGTQSAYDYAKAAVLKTNDRTKYDDFGNSYTDDNEQAASYVSDYAKVAGITVGYNGFTVSGGVDIVSDDDLDFKAHLGSATIETPEFAFSDDAVKVQAAAQFSRFAFKLTDALKVAATAMGASVKSTVAVQDITIGVAADMGLDYLSDDDEKDTQFNFDARVDFKYNFVDASIYAYAGKSGLEFGKVQGQLFDVDIYDYYKDFYLEAKAAFDLNAFELPLKVTVSAKNITNSEAVIYEKLYEGKAGIAPSIKVEYAKDAITAAASFGLTLNDGVKDWNALVYGTYAFEKFTAGAGLKLDGETELKTVAFAAFAETTKLVNGATFGFAYGLDAGKVYSDGCAAALSTAAKYKANFKADPIVAGNAVAYCKIAF